MGKKNILLRPVREDDAKELAAIYRPYVTDTAITFEYEAPDASEFVRRIRAVTKKISLDLCRRRDGPDPGIYVQRGFQIETRI